MIDIIGSPWNPVRGGLLVLAVATLWIASAQAHTPAPLPSLSPNERSSSTALHAETLAAARPATQLRLIPPAELELFVDGLVTSSMATDHILGVTVAVVQGGKPVLLKGYGLASLDSGRAVDPERTLFRIGSISKTFTWTALMQQIEQGRIDLDDPINKFLDENHKVPDQGFRQPIRVVNLMSHAAGFEDNTMEYAAEADGAKAMPLSTFIREHRPNRVREPGLLSSYSNYGAALAGYIAAQVCDEEFVALIERDVLLPLGMTSSTFREPYPARPGMAAPMSAELSARLSDGYYWTGDRYRRAPFEYLTHTAPSGGASVTAADMARYMLMQLNGGTLDGATIYGEKTAKAFRTPIMDVPEPVNGWAHGYEVATLPGGFKGYGHGGGLSAFMSRMMVIPELDLGIFVSSNTNTGVGLQARFPRQLVEEFYYPQGRKTWRQGDAHLAEEAGNYAGDYRSVRHSYSGLQKFASLFRGQAQQVSITNDGYLLTGAQLWAPDGAPGRFKAANGSEVMLFDLDAHGRATRIISDVGNLERIGFLRDRRTFLALGGMTLATALANLIAAIMNGKRKKRVEKWQARVTHIVLLASGLWLVSFAALWKWTRTFAIRDAWMAGWPSTALVIASSAALLATLSAVAILTLVLFRGWKPAPQEADWDVWSKIHVKVPTAVYLLFGALVAIWGGLLPWRI